MLKKIWNNPVWSKVIAAGIISLIGVLAVYVKSIIDNISLNAAFKEVLSFKINLLFIITVFIIIIIIIKFYRRYSSNWKKRKFQEVCKKFHDTEKGILYRFSVEFEDYKPTIEKLDIYCTKHDIPLGFIDFKCPVKYCSNSHKGLDESRVINFLESALIGFWEESK